MLSDITISCDMKLTRFHRFIIPIVVLIIITMIIPYASVAPYDDNTPSIFLYDGPNPASSITVWLGGTKKTVPVGVSVDSKTRQLTLYEQYDNDMYDITNAKNVKWIALPMSDSGISLPSDFSSAKSEMCAVSVSKGKVSARTDGTAMVIALKANNENKIVAFQSCVVTVLVGPNKIIVQDEEGKAVKNLTVGVGETANVYLSSTAKTDVHPNEVYLLEFIKDGFEYAAFGNRSPTYTVSQSMLENTPIPIKGWGLSKDKLTKVGIQITAVNSGKTAKFNFSVGNSVYSTPSNPMPITMSYSTTRDSTYTVTGTTIRNLVTTSASYFNVPYVSDMPITDNPKIYITDTEPTASNMIDANGKMKAPTKSTSGLSAKIDKDYNLTLSLKKASESMKSDKSYVVIAFNNSVRNEQLSGCVVFEVNIAGIEL